MIAFNIPQNFKQTLTQLVVRIEIIKCHVTIIFTHNKPFPPEAHRNRTQKVTIIKIQLNRSNQSVLHSQVSHHITTIINAPDLILCVKHIT